MSTLGKNCLRNKTFILACSRWQASQSRQCSQTDRRSTKEQLPEIKIPRKKKRDDLTVLKALSSTVGEDYGSLNAFRMFIEDPELLGSSTKLQMTYMASKISGRNAARQIMEEYDTLVQESLTQDPPVPNIHEFFPKKCAFSITEHCEDGLLERIEMRRVEAAYQMFEEMDIKDISQPTLEKLLELLCFIGDNDLQKEDPEIKFFPIGTIQTKRNKYSYKYAQDVFNSMDKTESAYNSILRGSLYALRRGVMEDGYLTYHREMVQKQIKFEQATYHTILQNARLICEMDKSSTVKFVLNLLKEMKRAEYSPTVETFNAALEGVNLSMNAYKISEKIVSEMKRLHIEPNLTTWNLFLNNAIRRNTVNSGYVRELKPDFDLSFLSSLLHVICDEMIGKEFEVQHPKDNEFMMTMMVLNGTHLLDLKLAYKIDEILMLGRNKLLLATNFDEVKHYYFHFLKIVAEQDELDNFMQLWRRVVPNKFLIQDMKRLSSIIDIWKLVSDEKFDYFAEILKGMPPFTYRDFFKVFASKEFEPALQTTFANFMDEERSRLRQEENLKKEGKSITSKKTPLTNVEISYMITVAVKAGQFENAWFDYTMLSDQRMLEPLSNSIELLLMECIQQNNQEKVTNVLTFMVKNHMENTEKCLQQALALMPLSEDEREKLMVL